MKSAVVVDYGTGNIGSISNFIRHFDFNIEVSNFYSSITESDLVILPGVGSFGSAKLSLDLTGASQAITERFKAGKPILGICLGFQLMTNSSEESEGMPGLGFFNVPTRRLIYGPAIGWQKIVPSATMNSFSDSYYFNHSFGVFGSVNADECSISGKESYLAYVRKENLIGTQFHPEKSQHAGFAFLTRIFNQYWFDLK